MYKAGISVSLTDSFECCIHLNATAQMELISTPRLTKPLPLATYRGLARILDRCAARLTNAPG